MKIISNESDPVSKIRVLIVGMGSIGRRHARLLQQQIDCELIAIRSNLGCAPNDFGIHEIFSWEDIDRYKIDAAIIANPTYMHVLSAIQCAKRGLHLFIEKPIDCQLEGIEELIAIVNDKSISSYIAYPFRFNPVVRALGEHLKTVEILHANMICASYLPKWRPHMNCKETYSCFKGQGGGVLLDMSHELDMAEFLFGPILEIKGKLSRISEVTVDSDDCADLILIHKHSSTNVHLNLFGQQARRYIEVDTATGYIRADLLQSSIIKLDGSASCVDEFQVDQDHMYREQLQYFFSNLGRTDMENNLEQASSLYRKIIKFREEQNFGNINNHLRQSGIAGS